MAIIQKTFYPEATEYSSFAILLVSSFTATIIGTLFTEQTNKETLIRFYKTTRPFGLWNPIKLILPEEKKIQINSENKRDIIAICFALPWQIVLFLTGMTMILKRFDLFGYLIVVLIGLSLGLYYFWFRYLSTEVKVE